ncbi:MAG: hypothetical protein K6T66_11540 [Peptococcaceae bacterium]|nr:hypothetical protein [Peptococcaceae bacterium]
MAGIKWRNMALRILSVLLAVLLWIYATNEQNPVNDQILSIQLQRRDPPAGMVVSGSIPSNVSIRVQGSRTRVAALTPADFQAVLDLSGLSEGDHNVPVKVSPPPGIQVIQVTPGRVYVVVESVVEKQVDVAAAFKGNPAKGYTALEPAIQPSKVTLRGPGSKVNAIDHIKVTVDVESATGVVDQTVPVSSGQNGVTVSPQSVRVTVPVTPLPSKTVAVRAGVVGEPAREYEMAGVTVNPANVQVTAPSEALSGINWVETENIDIKGADRDVTVRIGVRLPTGAVEIKPAAVEVTVHLRKARGQESGASGQPGR